MIKEHSKGVILQIFALFVLFFALSIFSSMYFDDGGIFNGIKYSLFQIFGMFIPGMMLLTLLRPKRLSQIELIIYSFVLGYGCSLIVYFLTVPFGLKHIIPWVYLLLVIISVGYIVYEYKRKKLWVSIENDTTGFWVCCIVGFLLLLMEIIMSCGLHTLPIHQATSSYQDFLFGVGNTIACSKEYPIVNFRAIFQRNYSYHYMYNIHLATMKIILKIPAFQLTAFYSYIQTVVLLTGGSYLFFRSVLGDRKKRIIFGMVMVLFTTGYESVHGMTYPGHMYMTPNNFDVALAFGMILVAVIYKQTICEKLNLHYIAVSVISLVLSFGSKAPLGMLAASVCGVLGILYIIREKKIKLIVPYAILFGVIGLVLYKCVLSGNAEGSVKLSKSASGSSIYFWGIMPSVQEWLMGLCGNLPQWLVHLCLGIYYGFVSYYPIFILFIIGLIGYFIYYKDIEMLDVALFGTVPIGISITVLYAHPGGGSQYYFLLGALPYAVAFGLRGIQTILKHKKRVLIKQVLLCLCSFCALSGILNVRFATAPESMVNEFNRGVSYLLGQTVETEEHHSWLANLVYPEEYEGYSWLREHIGEMDVILSDMWIAGYTRYSYSVGVFSERYVYVPDDRDELRACYQGGEKAIREVMNKANVKYMIQTLRVTPDLDIPTSLGEIVFENDAMKIYKLQD